MSHLLTTQHSDRQQHPLHRRVLSRRRSLQTLGTSLCLCFSLTACGFLNAATGDDDAAASPAASSSQGTGQGEKQGDGQTDNHGHIAGAQELDQAPASLATLTSDGEVSTISLADLSSTQVATTPKATAMSTDSRLLLVRLGSGLLNLTDSGLWTQDHGDHQHYYQAKARELLSLSSSNPKDSAATAVVTSSGTHVVVSSGEHVEVFDREKLENLERFTPDPGVAVLSSSIDAGSYAAPLGSHLVAVQGGQARILDLKGTTIGETVPCPQASGGITTRAGVVIGCQGGAVLASAPEAKDATPTLQWLALPADAGADAVVSSFAGRARRPEVAALDSQSGAWVLDVRKQTWTQLENPDSATLVALTAMDDTQDRVVGVDDQGRVHLWAGAAHVATTEPIASPKLAATSGISVTATHAYLPSAGEDSVLEINPAADGAVERTIPTPGLVDLKLVGT